MTNYYYTSTGIQWSQVAINNKLRIAYAAADEDLDIYVCECCGKRPPVDHDHTISQKRCKELHKTEPIIDPANWSYSCRTCHEEWESYKDGKFLNHNNLEKRMAYLEQHDPEGYQKRLFYQMEKTS